MTNNREFRINKYLTLRLEGGKTFIHVLGEKFKQCMYILLSIPRDYSGKAKSVDSIDEATKVFSNILDERNYRRHVPPRVQEILDEITPEEKFWAHCSNIQAWVENEYDSRILHSMGRRLFSKTIWKWNLRTRSSFGNILRRSAFRWVHGTCFQTSFWFPEKHWFET